MAVDKETVAEIARLARIRITAAESEALTGELSNILDWVEQLGELTRQHPAMADLTVDEMISAGLSAPLHEGALLYYKEMGWQ